MTKGEMIKKYRKLAGMTQDELAAKLDTTKQTVYKYENNIVTNIPSDKIEILAQLFKISPAVLMGWEKSGDFSEIIPASARSVPIMGTICAGTGVVCEDDYQSRFVIDAEVHADFALRVQGDSMKGAEIFDEDIIFIRKNVELINNYIYAVELLLTHEAVLRRVSFVNGSVILTPCNPDYEPVIAAPEDVRIIGRCVGVYHSL